MLAHTVPRQLRDISVGGLRIHSDERFKPGTRFEADLVFEDHGTATSLAEVVSVEELPPGSAARFDVGINFIDASAELVERIRLALNLRGERPGS